MFNYFSVYFISYVSYILHPHFLFSQLDFRTPPGFDRTRNVEIGNKNFDLTHLEEAYTSEHWLVRIFKVKDLENREKVKNLKHKKKARTTSRKVGQQGNVRICILPSFGYILNALKLSSSLSFDNETFYSKL